MLTAEQFIAAHKSNVEVLFGLTNKAFEGVEKLVELNLQVAKAALGEVAQTTQAALNAGAGEGCVLCHGDGRVLDVKTVHRVP